MKICARRLCCSGEWIPTLNLLVLFLTTTVQLDAKAVNYSQDLSSLIRITILVSTDSILMLSILPSLFCFPQRTKIVSFGCAQQWRTAENTRRKRKRSTTDWIWRRKSKQEMQKKGRRAVPAGNFGKSNAVNRPPSLHPPPTCAPAAVTTLWYVQHNCFLIVQCICMSACDRYVDNLFFQC